MDRAVMNVWFGRINLRLHSRCCYYFPRFDKIHPQKARPTIRLISISDSPYCSFTQYFYCKPVTEAEPLTKKKIAMQLILLLAAFPVLTTALAFAKPIPNPFPQVNTNSNITLEDQLNASAQCHTSGKCAFVVSVQLECADAGDMDAVAKCSCVKLEEGGKKVKEYVYLGRGGL